MSGRYPGYDVLAKRDTPSWNEQTRRVVDARLAIGPEDRRFFTPAEWETLKALSARILPQQPGRASPVPTSALIDAKLHEDRRDGYRNAKMPPQREAWKRGLHALDEESLARHGHRFHELEEATRDALLQDMHDGKFDHPAWGDMPADLFFRERVLIDHMNAYYSHPSAWNEIGFGGPASPRGYVRTGYDRRDPWEASEAKPGRELQALKENRRVR